MSTVGKLRQQSALKNANEKIIIKMIHSNGTCEYYEARDCYPDTSDAPKGAGFYIVVHTEDELP
jgi:hypothetical protein